MASRNLLWQNQFWEWNGNYYETVEDIIMRDRVYAFLDESKNVGRAMSYIVSCQTFHRQ